MHLAETSASSSPLNAFRFLHAPNRPSQLIWLAHHSRVDGTSMTSLLGELQLILLGKNPPETGHFCNAIRIQRELFNSRSKEVGAFWDRIRTMHLEATLLSLSKPDNIKDKRKVYQITLDSGINFEQAEEACRNNSLLLSTVVYAALARVLSVYTNADTSSFGIVLSGRNLPMRRVTSTVGPMITVCPFPIRPLRNCTVKKWLQDIHTQNPADNRVPMEPPIRSRREINLSRFQHACVDSAWDKWRKLTNLQSSL